MIRAGGERLTKAMVFGSAAWSNNEQRFYLSKVGVQRAERLAALYHSNEFVMRRAQVLLTGGYGAQLTSNPPSPEQREGALMADYLVRHCGVRACHLLLEDESTTTIENWQNSLGMYPGFFEGCQDGTETIGLVSHPNHLKRAVYIGSELGCRAERLTGFATYQADNALNEQAAMARTVQRIEALKRAVEYAA